MRPVNPYIVGNPIKDQAGFFGRQDIFREVMQVLRQPGSNAIVLYGQRRIGKTSVLLQLEKQLTHEVEFTPVYFDLQDKAAKSLTEVLYELSQHISKVTGHTVAKSSDFDRTGDYFRSVFLPEIAKKVASGGLVLLFDEFDVLDSPMRTQASEAFFPYLRQWMTDVQKVKFVFVIGRRPEDLSVRTMSTFKGIQSTRVSFLSERDAEDVARQSEKDGSLKWDKTAIQHVFDLTHGHPYFTQLLSSVVWENAYEAAPRDAPTVSAKDVEHAVVQALKFGANAFNWLWDGLPPAERVVVAAMAEVKDEVITQDKLIETLNQSGVRLVARELEFAPETLIDWEVLIESGGAYRFAVPLLQRWVLANRPLRRVKEELDRLDPLAETLFQGGQGFYNNNNLEAAEQQLREALKINPNHLKGRLLLGRILLEKGNLVESVDMFDAAYQYDERSARADLIKSLLALAETQEENLQLSTYERILKIQSDQPLANEKFRAVWVKRGEAAQAQENYEEAQRAFEQIGDTERIEKVRALMHEKKLALGMQRAEVYERSGQWKPALDVYVNLTSEFPDRETLREQLEIARTNWRSERLRALDLAEAEENWEKVLEICEALDKDFPGDADVIMHSDRARIQLKPMQNYREALNALERGNADQARTLFIEVLSVNPTHLRAAHRLIEATYGKVKITRPLPWGVWLPVGVTSLVWILFGVLASSGVVSAFAFTRYDQIPIEVMILVAILLAALIGIGVTLYAGWVLDTALQVDIKAKPFLWRALWTHLPLGMGLFYADHGARRKWLYPFVAMMIPIILIVGPSLMGNAFDKTQEYNPELFKYYVDGNYKGYVFRASGENESAAGRWGIALGVLGSAYLLSLVDVMGTCYLRRGKQSMVRDDILIKKRVVPQPKVEPSVDEQSNQLSYGRAILTHLNLGRGLFYVDPTARRKWVYPVFFFAIPISIIIGFLNDSTSDLGKFWISLGWTSILLYAFSFFDVLLTFKVMKNALLGNPGLAAGTWWPVMFGGSLILGNRIVENSDIFLNLLIALFMVVLFLPLWWISGWNVSTPPRWRLFLLFSLVFSVFVFVPYSITSNVTILDDLLDPIFNVHHDSGLVWGIVVVWWLLPILSGITFVTVVRQYEDQNYLTASLQGMIYAPIVGTAVGLVHRLVGLWPLDIGISYALITVIYYYDYLKDQFKLIFGENKYIFRRELLGMLIALLPVGLSAVITELNSNFYDGPLGTVSGIVATLGVAALLRYASRNYLGAKRELPETMPGQVKRASPSEPVQGASQNFKMFLARLPGWMKTPVFVLILGILPIIVSIAWAKSGTLTSGAESLLTGLTVMWLIVALIVAVGLGTNYEN